MKWNLTTTILLLVSLMVAYLLWQNWLNQKIIQNLQITSLQKQVDSLQNKTTESVNKYTERIVTNKKIVEKPIVLKKCIDFLEVEVIYKKIHPIIEDTKKLLLKGISEEDIIKNTIIEFK